MTVAVVTTKPTMAVERRRRRAKGHRSDPVKWLVSGETGSIVGDDVNINWIRVCICGGLDVPPAHTFAE
jgi:hypothetical protein